MATLCPDCLCIDQAIGYGRLWWETLIHPEEARQRYVKYLVEQGETPASFIGFAIVMFLCLMLVVQVYGRYAAAHT